MQFWHLAASGHALRVLSASLVLSVAEYGMHVSSGNPNSTM
jgi:hypothetical protein